MQNCKTGIFLARTTEYNMLTHYPVYASVYHFPMEGRSHRAHQANQYLSDLCPVKELLPVLHARFVVRIAHRRS